MDFESEKRYPVLPSELILQIMMLLPVQDILRCHSVCKLFHEVMEGSPQLQYQAELGIAGLVDRPPSVLSVSERLHLVKSHQLRMNRPQTCFERRHILWPQRRGVVKVAGDLLLQAYDRTLPTHQPHAVYNTVDIGLAHSLLFGDDEPIEWWTFRFDYHFSRFYVDPSQDLVVLVETAAGRPPSIPVRIISLTTGESMLDGFFDLPVPQEDVEWELNNVHVYGQLLAGVFKHPDSHGITITRWKDRVNWVNMLLPRGVGHTFAFVSETSFLVSSDLYDEYGLRLYSFNCDLNASNSTTPRAPNHIATYSFPSLVYSQTLGPHVSLIEPGKGAYTGERSKRLFTTSSGSLYVVNLRLIDSKDRFLTMGDFTFFINSSVFDQDFQSLHETGIPVHLPFDSWGSKLSRCLPNVRVQTLSNYIIACEGEQYDFNPLSVARDWHKTFLSGQNRQDSPISFNFGTTTIYSSTAFQKPITTSLPYRHSKCAGPWNIIFVEDWIYLEWVRGFQR